MREKQRQAANNRKRRAISQKVRRKVYKRYGGVCYLCGTLLSPDNFEIDHIVPFSKYGPDEISNYAPVHSICNKKKGNKL